MRLPNTKHRTLIVGRTGSGKTQAAVWHLANQNLVSRKWIVLNHKRTKLIDSIEHANFLDLNEYPTKPGVYIYHPVPEFDDYKVTELLWKVLAKENCGVYIDEGYMVNARDSALSALYTQGREKHIPMITLSQRPTGICRFGVSESDFFQVFPLNDMRDRKIVNAYIPFDLETLMREEPNREPKMPKFHSVYYDVEKNDLKIMAPVPDSDTILELFENQLGNKVNKKILI